MLEFDPLGQGWRGDLDRIHELIEQNYTHFIDIRRRDADPAVPRFRLQRANELRSLAERTLAPGTPDFFTDILLLGLIEEQAARGADLPRDLEERRIGKKRERF